MLYTLTFRVFLLAVATSATITALEAFNKFYHVQTCTPGPLQPAPGMPSMLCACARMYVSHVTGVVAGRGPESAGHSEGGLHRIQSG